MQATSSWPRRTASPARRQFGSRYFHIALAAAMTAIVLAGFWPSYFGPLLRGAAQRPWVLHLHGAIFLGWMALLIAQVALAARGRVAAHRKLGEFGIYYGALVWLMGIVVSFAASIMHVRSGEWTPDRAAGFLLIPLGDMVLFGGLFSAAILYRRKPEIHKRLIVLATVALLFAAVGRMPYLGQGSLLVAAWLSPALAGIAYDVFTRRRVHPAYLIGLGVLLVGFSRVFFLQSPYWMQIGRMLLEAWI